MPLTLLIICKNPDTYRELTVTGIKESWRGEYEGKKVYVVLTDVDQDPSMKSPGQKVVKIVISEKFGVPRKMYGWHYKSSYLLYLYQGDSRANY